VDETTITSRQPDGSHVHVSVPLAHSPSANGGPRDVFLCYHEDDGPSVLTLARQLEAAGIHPWLDEWHLIPGRPWMRAIEKALDSCPVCAIFIGPSGISPWQHEQMWVAIARRVADASGRYRVIPVILPGGSRGERAGMPAFLRDTRWVEFRTTLDDERAFDQLLSGVRGIPPKYLGAQEPSEPPYRGLLPFEIAHTRFFFGREALIEWLLDYCRVMDEVRDVSRFLAIVGASGSGKSSLARAGLLAALAQGHIESSASWRYAVLTPGTAPLDRLLDALAPVISPSSSFLNRAKVRGWLAKEDCLDRLVRRGLEDEPANFRLVVLIDQFEELFTLCANDEERRQFIAALVYAAGVARGRCIVIITLRSDFYSSCASFPDLAATLTGHQLLVGPLSRLELRRAIEQPAFVARYEFEPELVDTLLVDAGDQASLPLVQHALLQLWKGRDQMAHRLTRAAYKAIGGVAGALERHAETIYDQLSKEEPEVCRQVLLDLIQPGEAGDDTRRTVALDGLAPGVADRVLVARVVKRLTSPEARLLTLSDERSGERGPEVQIAHEILIGAWVRLSRWVAESRAELRMRRELSQAARRWNDAGRGREYLLSGRPLTDMASLARGNGLGEIDAAFLAACLSARRRARWARGVMVMLAVLLIAVSVGGFLLYRQQQFALATAESPWLRPAGPLGFNDPVTDLKLTGGASSLLYAATKDLGIGRSADGKNWAFTAAAQSRLPTGLPANGDPAKIIRATGPLAVDPLDTQLLLVAVQEHGIYRSTDGALSWRAANQGIAQDVVSNSPIAALDLRGALAVAAFRSPSFFGGPGRVYLSRDGGVSWRESTPPDSGQIYTALIAPAGDLIYVGAEKGVFRALAPADSAAQPRWERLPDLPPTIRLAFGIDNRTMFLATSQPAGAGLELLCWQPGAPAQRIAATGDQVRALTTAAGALYALQWNGMAMEVAVRPGSCVAGATRELRAHPGVSLALLAVPAPAGGTQLLLGHEIGVLQYRDTLGGDQHSAPVTRLSKSPLSSLPGER
jgi:hypothetical protein